MRSVLRIIICVLMMAGVVVPAQGQGVECGDSAVVDGGWISSASTGAAMTLMGALSRPGSEFAPALVEGVASRGFGVAEVAEFAPVVLPWAVKAFGGATRSGWGRMAVSQGIGGVIGLGTALIVKGGVDETRPDGADGHSFPSAHSAIAFMGASMTVRELGWRSPWYGVGAMAVASGVGMQRVIARRHYPADVAAGAGIGVLSTQLGYLIGDVIFGRRGLDRRYAAERGCVGNRSYVGVSTGLDFYLGNPSVGGWKVHRQAMLATRMEGAWAFGDHLSIGGELGLGSVPVELRDMAGDVRGAQPRPLTELSVGVLPGYTLTVGSHGALILRGGGGYVHRMTLHWPGRRLQSGRDTGYGAVSVGGVVALSGSLALSVEARYRVCGYEYRLDGGRIAGTDNVVGLSAGLRAVF